MTKIFGQEEESMLIRRSMDERTLFGREEEFMMVYILRIERSFAKRKIFVREEESMLRLRSLAARKI